MENIKFYVLAILCVISISFGYAQTQQSNEIDKVEKNTSPFSLNYFSNKESSLYVLTARVQDKKIVIDEKATIVEVPGKLPYNVGNFKVNVLDRQGELLSSFTMQDPMLVRSCEKETGEVSLMEKGQIQIPIPKAKNIAQIDIFRDEKRVQRLDIKKVMDSYLKQREEE